MTILLIVANLAFFGWQLSFSGDEEFSASFPGVTERDVNSIEFGAVPYRLTHPGKDCSLGAQEVTATQAEAGVVCEGTEEFDEAVALTKLCLAAEASADREGEPLEPEAWYQAALHGVETPGL